MLLQDLKEFSQETSIHGLGQIADDAATKTKRFLWIIIFVGSLSYAGVMLYDAYHGRYNISNNLAQLIWFFFLVHIHSGPSMSQKMTVKPDESTFYVLTQMAEPSA